MKQSLTLSLLVVFCFILVLLPVFLISSFFLGSRIILHTAVCSEDSDLLAKTPELTSDMCCEDLTQTTTR